MLRVESQLAMRGVVVTAQQASKQASKCSVAVGRTAPEAVRVIWGLLLSKISTTGRLAWLCMRSMFVQVR